VSGGEAGPFRKEQIMRATISALVAVFIVALVAPAPAQEQAEVKVQAVLISEVRQAALVEVEDVHASPGLEVRLRLEGSGGESATEWGNMRIDQATDDKGTDLKREERGFGGRDDFEAFDPFARMRSDRQPDRQRPRELSLRLNLPPRDATKVTELRGQFQIRTGGEQKQVELTGLPGQLGKQVENADLQRAGLQLTILDPAQEQRQGEGNTLIVRIAGDDSVIQGFSVVDAENESVSHGRFSMGMNNQRTHHFELTRPLEDGMKLQIELLLGQQTVTVPFEFTDLALP
jgi:hypothetical protein